MIKKVIKILHPSKQVFIAILPSARCSLRSKTSMSSLVSLKWVMITPTDRNIRSGIVLTADPLPTITRSMGLFPNILEMKMNQLWSSTLAYFSSSENEIVAKHAILSGGPFRVETFEDWRRTFINNFVNLHDI